MNEQAIQLLVQIWHELKEEHTELLDPTQRVITEIEEFLEAEGYVQDGELNPLGESLLY